ncbi:MAG: class D beta-lactamase [Gammaproteobacteria bacterium]
MHKHRYKIFVIFICLLFSLPVAAEDPAIAELFDREGIDGTLVISSLSGGKTFVHGESRAGRRFSPASTFKIFNTLIALETKAVSGKDAVLTWNGHRYAFPDWNRDQTLESAFKISCVWCFQELARRIGAQKYRHYLRKAAYGELTEPFELTTFWLDGSLTISALEQVEFLKKIYRRSLPFDVSSYATLRQIMSVEQTPDFTIRAKTGWAARVTPQVGWYVGYVETLQDVWLFAANIDIRSENDLSLRRKLTREALQLKGIID